VSLHGEMARQRRGKGNTIIEDISFDCFDPEFWILTPAPCSMLRATTKILMSGEGTKTKVPVKEFGRDTRDEIILL
jgi:hypothetical protein